MSRPEFDPFDPDSIVCEMLVSVGGIVSYADYAEGKTDSVTAAAVILTAVFHRMQTYPDFNQQMLDWAHNNFGATEIKDS